MVAHQLCSSALDQVDALRAVDQQLEETRTREERQQRERAATAQNESEIIRLSTFALSSCSTLGGSLMNMFPTVIPELELKHAQDRARAAEEILYQKEWEGTKVSSSEYSHLIVLTSIALTVPA